MRECGDETALNFKVSTSRSIALCPRHKLTNRLTIRKTIRLDTVAIGTAVHCAIFWVSSTTAAKPTIVSVTFDGGFWRTRRKPLAGDDCSFYHAAVSDRLRRFDNEDDKDQLVRSVRWADGVVLDRRLPG